MRNLAVVLLLAAAVQAEPEFLLRDGDRVVFLGDSITEQRLYTRYVQQFVYCRYPDLDIRFYNAGWGGDTARGALGRLERDVLSLKPTVVTICFGMNDGRYRGPDRGILKEFKAHLTTLVRTLNEAGVRVVVFSPGCVDPDRRKSLAPYNDALRGLAKAALDVARKEKCAGSADIFTPMLAFQKARKKKDPKFTMLRDAVHPESHGHRVMARPMLAALGAEPMPALGIVDVARDKGDGLKLVATGDRRYVLETTRPLPTPFWFEWWVMPTMRQSGFLDSFAGQRLVVKGLKAGTAWDVVVDHQVCGTYPAAALGKGVALSGWHRERTQVVHDLVERKESTYFATWRRTRIPHGRHKFADETVAALMQADEGFHKMIRAACRPRTEALVIRLAEAPIGDNLAFKKGYKTSDPNRFNWGVGGLTDGSWRGDRRTCFSTGESARFPKHVTVDLGAVARIGCIRLGVPAFGSTKKVQVSVSRSNKGFTKVGEVEFGLKTEERRSVWIKPTLGRWVRLTYVDHHLEQAGYTNTFAFTTELEVYAAR